MSRNNNKFLIGIDEVGRGPLAGPVAVGVVMVPGNFDWESKLPGVTDSKQLSEKKREELFERAKVLKKAGELEYAVSMVSANVIDRIGIVPAVNRAMDRSLHKVTTVTETTSPRSDLGLEAVVAERGMDQARANMTSEEATTAINRSSRSGRCDDMLLKLDGGLKAPERFVHQETIIKGDAKEPVIGLASIMAKVTRDRYMVRIAPQFALYDFHIHKGYGTKAHRLAIEINGLSIMHRRSYCKNIRQR